MERARTMRKRDEDTSQMLIRLKDILSCRLSFTLFSSHKVAIFIITSLSQVSSTRTPHKRRVIRKLNEICVILLFLLFCFGFWQKTTRFIEINITAGSNLGIIIFISTIYSEFLAEKSSLNPIKHSKASVRRSRGWSHARVTLTTAIKNGKF